MPSASADAHGSPRGASGRLLVVATPLGNLGDITERAKAELAAIPAQVAEGKIDHDHRAPEQMLGITRSVLEGRIAIGRFLQRFPDYQLTQAPVRGGRARFRGFLNAAFST